MVASSRTPGPNPPSGSPPGGSRPPDISDGEDHARDLPADPLTTALLHFGLGLREAQLYRALLKYGPMSARQSIGLAGLDRATGYRVLSKLRARGLISSTPTRPQRFVPMEVGRLFDRTVSLLRDDLELLRVLREHYMTEGSRGGRDSRTPGASTAATHLPARPHWPTIRIYPRAEEIGRGILAHLDSTKEDFDALMMPQVLPEGLRGDVARSLAHAVERGARCRVVLDYHPADLEFLASVLRSWGTVPHGLEFRFYAPQIARLYIIDHRVAMRCIRTSGSPATGPELGISSDDPEFLRYHNTRFQSVWREALPIHKTEGGFPASRPNRNFDNPRDLRRWVERGALVTGRVASSELAALFGLTVPGPRRL